MKRNKIVKFEQRLYLSKKSNQTISVSKDIALQLLEKEWHDVRIFEVVERKQKEKKNSRSAVDETHREKKEMPKSVNNRIEIKISH